jgi:hypothetical protein
MTALRLTGGMHSQSKRLERYGLIYSPEECSVSFLIQVIQQTLGHQVSQPVAQIIAGFAKVFVGEMIEKGRLITNVRTEMFHFLDVQ